MRLRLGLKALGLCALMAAFMAISAGAAQAEAGSKWMEAGKNIEGTTQSSEVKGELEGSLGKLLATINGLNIVIDCKEGTLNGIKLTANGSTTEGDVSFSKCTVSHIKEGKELAIAGCEVRSEDQAVGSGKILSLPGKALLGLHPTEKPVTKIIPTSGIFAHLIFEEEKSGEPCGALPLKLLVGGQLVVEDCEGKAKEEKPVHLIVEEKELTTLWIYKESIRATLDGSALIKLANGANWSALPN